MSIAHKESGLDRAADAVPQKPVRRPRRVAQARCPIRFGEPCTLCQPGASGPEDCQTVAMVMADPELREMMAQMNREHRARA